MTDKEKHRAACAKYRAKYPDRVRQSLITWRKQHQKEYREQSKIHGARWRSENPEKYKVCRDNYRDANQEKIRAYAAAYREKNRERQRAYDRNKYASNPEASKQKRIAMAAIHAEWRKKNKAKIDLENAKRYRLDPESAKARVKQFAKDNPEIASRSRAVRRARKLNAIIGDTKEIARWERKWRKAKLVSCRWCKSKVPGSKAHADHVVPLSKGGSHSRRNLCIACPSCNLRKHAKLPKDWRKHLAAVKPRIEQPKVAVFSPAGGGWRV
jgi:5-methylcytosine-specific restriction endonuclease McrA